MASANGFPIGKHRDRNADVFGDLFGRLRLKYFAQEFVGLHGQTLRKTPVDGKCEWVTKWRQNYSAPPFTADSSHAGRELLQPAGIWSTTRRPVSLMPSLGLYLPAEWSASLRVQSPNCSTASSRRASCLAHSSGRAPLMGALQKISRNSTRPSKLNSSSTSLIQIGRAH